MNNLSIVIGVLFFICVLAGCIKGLFKSVLSVASLIAGIVIAVYASPHLSACLEENTQIDEKIAAYIIEKLEYSEVGEELSRSLQVAVINELALPETLKAGILDNNNSEIYSLLDVTGVYDYIAKSIAVVLLNAAVFLALTLLCRLVFFVMCRQLKDLTKLPIVRSIDKIGGACFGVIKGLIYIWLFFLVLSVCSTFEWSQSFILQIHDSKALELLYEHNILLDIVCDFTKLLFP